MESKVEKMNDSLISVVMLTYNREELICRAINSILGQSYKNIEFIIIDNGSTDKSGEIADDYAAHDKRIRVCHCERRNIGSGRNIGLQEAKGDYIFFIDDDDWAETDCLSFLYELITTHNADMAICGAFDRQYDERCVMSNREAIIELLWRKKYNMAFPAKLFRRTLFDGLWFPDVGEFDDISLMYKIIANASKVVYDGRPLYTFYRHENNTSAWTTNHKLLNRSILQEYMYAYRVRTEWLSNKFPEDINIFRYFEWSFMISMVEKINRLDLTDCYEEEKKMLKELHENKDEFMNSLWILDFEKKWMEQYV